MGAALGREVDRLVEHRDHRVEALDGELLLAEEDAAQVVLEALDLGQACEQALLLFGAELAAVTTGLDRLAQPDSLLVVGDVLDLVGTRTRVGLLQLRQHLGERLARRVHAQQRRGDTGLQLRGQPRLQPFRLQRRVSDRLAPERIEARSEVAVRT